LSLNKANQLNKDRELSLLAILKKILRLQTDEQADLVHFNLQVNLIVYKIQLGGRL
jgi:hypothetical protein